MELKDAVELINHDAFHKSGTQTWADLGCGSGTFTTALAYLLFPGSIIYAVDKNKSALNRIPSQINNVKIERLHMDFVIDDLPGDLDGILMANSFHYVDDKISLIKKLENNLKSEFAFLIVEYDTNYPNPWVPFPLSFKSLKNFFENLGYTSVTKLNERSSSFRRANIYSAIIEKE